jgi:hypothetical protein
VDPTGRPLFLGTFLDPGGRPLFLGLPLAFAEAVFSVLFLDPTGRPLFLGALPDAAAGFLVPDPGGRPGFRFTAGGPFGGAFTGLGAALGLDLDPRRTEGVDGLFFEPGGRPRFFSTGAADLVAEDEPALALAFLAAGSVEGPDSAASAEGADSAGLRLGAIFCWAQRWPAHGAIHH